VTRDGLLYQQRRAQPWAWWMILCMNFSYRLDGSAFAVKASLNPTAVFTVCLLALGANMAVLRVPLRRGDQERAKMALRVQLARELAEP